MAAAGHDEARGEVDAALLTASGLHGPTQGGPVMVPRGSERLGDGRRRGIAEMEGGGGRPEEGESSRDLGGRRQRFYTRGQGYRVNNPTGALGRP